MHGRSRLRAPPPELHRVVQGQGRRAVHRAGQRLVHLPSEIMKVNWSLRGTGGYCTCAAMADTALADTALTAVR